MLKNTGGDDDENSRRDMYLLLIFVLIIRNRSPFLRGQSGMVDEAS
jgi:hypothetical protein